jgi:hypothetical protein
LAHFRDIDLVIAVSGNADDIVAANAKQIYSFAQRVVASLRD